MKNERQNRRFERRHFDVQLQILDFDAEIAFGQSQSQRHDMQLSFRERIKRHMN